MYIYHFSELSQVSCIEMKDIDLYAFGIIVYDKPRVAQRIEIAYDMNIACRRVAFHKHNGFLASGRISPRYL